MPTSIRTVASMPAIRSWPPLPLSPVASDSNRSGSICHRWCRNGCWSRTTWRRGRRATVRASIASSPMPAAFEYAASPQGSTSTAAEFEIDSTGSDRIDGLVARQIGNASVVPQTLGGGETHVVGLDLVLPSNGFDADVLQALTIELVPAPAGLNSDRTSPPCSCGKSATTTRSGRGSIPARMSCCAR
jgi:hypothetical protein